LPSAVAIDVIDIEEHRRRLTTARAFPAIGHEDISTSALASCALAFAVVLLVTVFGLASRAGSALDAISSRLAMTTLDTDTSSFSIGIRLIVASF